MELPSFYRIFFQIFFCLWQMQGFRQHASNKKSARTLLTLTLLLLASASINAQPHSLIQVRQEIVSFLAEHYGSTYERVEINVPALDKRLRITHCDQPLVITPQDPTALGGNITVQVQCKSQKSWAVHVPAQVYLFDSIPVAARSLPRGSILSASDIHHAVVNISTIRQAFINSTDDAIGKELNRTINQGEPLRSANLSAPTAIKRGDTVSVESLAGGLKVSTSGTAMSDGRIGQKIRIRNTQSSRVITAKVIGQGQAQTD